jgi:hypothetical protein
LGITQREIPKHFSLVRQISLNYFELLLKKVGYKRLVKYQCVASTVYVQPFLCNMATLQMQNCDLLKIGDHIFQARREMKIVEDVDSDGTVSSE